MAVLVAVAVLSVAVLLFVNAGLHALNENSYLARKVGFSKALTVTNRARGVGRERRPKYFFAWDLLDVNHLVAGYVIGVRPLLCYRVFVLLLFVFTIIQQGVWGVGLGGRWLTYFSNWTFMAMAMYALLGIIISHKAANGEKYKTSWEQLDKVFILVFVSACSCGIFLTIFYWMILYDGERLKFYEVVHHGGNVLVMLGELFLSKIPICSYHMQIALHYLGVYAVFQWVYAAASGVWIYETLSFESYRNLAYYFIVPILMALSFYLMYLVAYVRQRLFEGRFGGNSLEMQPSLDMDVEMSASV